MSDILLSPSRLDARQQLRQLLRQRRRALSPQCQKQAATGLYLQLAQHPWFRRARHVALYLANDGEIDPSRLIEAALQRKKSVYLPVVSRWPERHMVFQRVDARTRWCLNKFGIREPVPDRSQQRALWTLDLVCLPLVGFDAAGGRLGMGGGFYDRTLAACQLPLPRLLGVAHACQQVESVPLAPWDMPLDAVVTDREWFACGKKGQTD